MTASPFEDGGRHVRHFGAGRGQLSRSSFSICVATTTGLPARRTARIDLQRPGIVLQRQFDAQIAAADHDAVGDFEDRIRLGDRLGLSIFAMTPPGP